MFNDVGSKTYRSRMMFDTAPVVEKTNNDKYNNKNDLDECKPIL
jgi:hypothetical protein